MKKNYGHTIWKMLREYAIWQPGDIVALGDFGVIRDNCFERIGNIRDYISDTEIKAKANELGEVSVRSDYDVERSNQKDIVNLNYQFKKNNGVLLSAREVQVNTFLELQKTARLIAAEERWDRSWFVVTSVRTAGRFVLVISKDLNMSIEGEANAVDEFLEGRSDNASAVKLTGAINLKIVGGNGPLSVRLHQLKEQGDSFKHLEHGVPDRNAWVLAPYMNAIPEE
ncbi:hypothetical protein [Chitinophaga pinensis]|uniref:Uncharacterized protein n=1 Tax=Chitinophaga pinensis (strain ATCC 43595 / DSM 2588 / LMG 13176 / NBRC 15968 / NCIMB 11800 / UQM 2034) TaxID=485918 RepID=A0A979GA33_CHIPD|nr:hypothetical protein [Chitinophaga pinensis]ACU63477.1 hypothetical protein Cpin_6065 [Chitinophaga pinensis DSM 2588]